MKDENNATCAMICAKWCIVVFFGAVRGGCCLVGSDDSVVLKLMLQHCDTDRVDLEKDIGTCLLRIRCIFI